MTTYPDTGQSGKRKGPVSFATDQPGISKASAEYHPKAQMQGGNGFVRSVRLAAVALTVAEFVEWAESFSDGRADNALLGRQYREGVSHE